MQKYLSCRYFPTSSLLSPVTPMAWKNSTAGFFLSPSAANRMIIPLRPLLWWFAFANCDSLEKPPSGSILSAPSHQQPISADHLYNVTGIFLQSHCSTRLFFLYDGSKISRNYWLFEPKCRNNAEITYTQRLQIASYFP